ncbi:MULTISPECIES: pullulanase-type alpha-1,6-glucosidase [unclassified Kitasatospora]|uniref:pullulanase-type alpha-1,6-glucosidase n=1 Tax=unclassified Kitasatospora TaxID=2633591 RepID=UPI00070F005A|nr:MULTISPECIES: pullulanase-type alpha-1,6-glucosidase [unclassified Kitasatospora]KQV14411.1 sulfonate ABC transporter ATP-binding protein [Kitasatospora sp. Root107]KRB66239.1 sulfonate ABC transporter ATP-binding protein [Kitasatospora sp. Root187]
MAEAQPRRPRSTTTYRRPGRTAVLIAASLLATGLGAAPLAMAAPAGPPSDKAMAAEADRHDLTREQFYFVLPDRFANGEAKNDTGGLTGTRLETGLDPADKGFYHGGDLQGLIDKLDYVQGLGTTAIWMAPLFKNRPVQGTGADASAGYHGYWITDFTQVDPHFGTNAQLKELIAKAHRKGIKVFFDVITNHTADVVDYTEGKYDYRSAGAYPTLDADGNPVDETAIADAAAQWPKIGANSFPYTPSFRSAADQKAKTPSWLNDPALYHNRGNSTFVGESSTEGDFSGLDDLDTQNPRVVEGMKQIYQTWVKESGVDGFRIDTVKHVNMAFWSQWAPALKQYAAERGNQDFFMFGEVYSGDPSVTAPYVTKGKLQATLDFAFQESARKYVSQGGSAKALAELYAQDFRYTTADTNAYELPTFLGNHDMGRFGSFLQSDNPGASAEQLLQKDRFANELMFLTRGQPVVYYGDEQGFTGAGGDKDARQDMFASKTGSYNADTVIGGSKGPADRYGQGGALYQGIATLAGLRKAHPALADGAQVERYAADGAGVYAFSRIDAGQQVEYLVAVNNSAEPKTVTLDTFSAGMDFKQLYPSAGAKTTSGADRKVTVTVPAYSSVVHQAAGKLAKPAAAPQLALKAPENGSTGTVTIGAEVPGGGFNRVSFAAQIGNGPWQQLGSADNGTYRVTQDLTGVAPGTVVRYKAVVKDSGGNLRSATGSFTTGTPAPKPAPSATSRPYAVVHYQRKNADYDGWNMYAWGDLADGESTPWPDGHGFTGRDAYGAFAYVKLKSGAADVGFVVEKGGTKDGEADRHIDLGATGEVWVKEGDPNVYTKNPDPAVPVPADTAVIHYYRADGKYDGWGLHDWTGAATPTDWGNPLLPARKDAYGAVFEVPLAAGATSLSYILHNGNDKDLPNDQSLNFATSGREIWLIGGQEGHLLPQAAGSSAQLDLTSARAQWIDTRTVLVPANFGAADSALAGGTSAQLIYDADGGLTVDKGVLNKPGQWIRLNPGTLTDAQKAKYPHLAGYRAFTVDGRDAGRITKALRSQLIFTEHLPSGAALAATGVQIPGVLDDLYAAKAAKAQLGPVYRKSEGWDWWGDDREVTLSLWAPTATEVSVQLFDGATGGTPRTVPLRRDEATGVWSLTRDAGELDGKYYLYQVKVWAPSVRQNVTNLVTDPYSVALSADSKRSLVADLAGRDTKPRGWDGHRSPQAVSPSRQQIQELHVRDFSSADATVPAAERGTYKAFTESKSAGMQHLRELAQAGVTTIHLLPTFDIATVRENRADQKLPACDLNSLAADSEQQQECVAAVKAEDAYNWGYDPLHYTVPEGSYATEATGTARTVQFREMVQAMHEAGLRVVLDVVYNHTAAAGQAEHSVLDKVVPGYYQRLSDAGAVTTDSCCADTAPEHAMMNKLVVDSVLTWAKEYRVDGFRFDLMGLDPKQTMLDVQSALRGLSKERDGVEGKDVFLYGEGWNFGVVANNSRFEQASQLNMAGTGIATFNDRVRDAARGGNFMLNSAPQQGFASGLYTDPNGSAANGTSAEQQARLLHQMDQIKVGLTGNLAGFGFTDSSGKSVTGAGVDYNGSPTGYAANPGEAVEYVDAHDNADLFDALAYKLPTTTTPADRARMQALGLSLTALSQGPGFAQAGSDLLRSKSLDANSFDSGDWFNSIQWDCTKGNGWGRGLPMAADNKEMWPTAKSLLADPRLTVGCNEIQATGAQYRQFLRIRQSSPLFALSSAAEVQQRLSFPLSGTAAETPGVITMHLDGAGLRGAERGITVVFNATPTAQQQTVAGLKGTGQSLHQVQAQGADPVVKSASFDRSTGTFTVPARTVAVFVQG